MKFSLVFVLSFIAFVVEAELPKDAKHRCEQYTSVFENDTTELQYAYVENIHDGRGYTAGRAGFTTGTADAYEVVKKYTAKKANNPLAKFLPELERLAKEGKMDGDVSKLTGYPAAWKEAAKDVVFRETQDEVSDEMYYRPAMQLASAANVKSNVGMCAFYDCIIQHGSGDDPDSIEAIIKKTEQTEGGPVKTDEKKWILEFLKTRRNDLQHPNNKETQKEWAQSVDRVDEMVKIINAGNMDMKGPIHINSKEHQATIN